MPAVETRYQLQAWHLLREMAEKPPSTLENLVRGVVVEVGLESGHDLLGAYADRTAYYYNYSGAGVVWKRPDSSLDSLIDALLDAAAAIVSHIGPWTEARRPAPTTGHIRLNILTPNGLYFGEGPFEQMDRDPLARPMVQAATKLMSKLASLPAERNKVG